MAALLHPEIAEALARGVTILTANQRAARTLRRQADLDRHAAGHITWRPPTILAWDTWTAILWRQLLLDGHATQLLLNAAQEHTLWRGLIAADPEWHSLLAPDRIAELAADAWSRLCAYRGEARLRASATSADTRAFARWAQSFSTRCRDEGYLPPAQLETSLARHSLPLSPSGYVLVGFDRFTPARQALLAAVRECGIAVAELSLPPIDTVQLYEAPETNQELQATAQAIRRHLEQHSTARISLIVPDPAAHRAEIDRALGETLAPETNTIASTDPPPFEFSLGIPLAQTSLVADALDLLRWAVAPLATIRISHLLLSPHFGGGRDLPARAAFDASTRRLHRPLRPELSLAALLRLVESPNRHLPELGATLRSFRRAIADQPLNETRSHADWADIFRALLAAAGWGKGLDSIGFQTLGRWENTLDQLAPLDFTGLRAPYNTALSALERLTRQTLFAPESRNAPVQIMGPLEAAGSTFDAIWFLGAGDATWPRRPSTSPLLSWHLQRDLQMPGTSAAHDLADARHTASRIAAAAPLVTFSYAREFPDRRQRPSPAITGLALIPVEFAPRPRSTPFPLEAIDDTTTLPPLPDRILPGGAAILQHQAACGFRAFAEHRLSATALDRAESGMNARDRGSVVHQILQTFWSGVQTQDALRALTPDARRAILTGAIEAALRKTAANNAGVWSAAYLDVLCERLLTVLDTWLRKELDRQVPFLVRAEELQLDDVRLGPLRLSLRVDRIDETEFGDLILDYKTGDAKPAHWLTDRPDEPQLPLYAVVSATPVAGVAFASIRAGKDMDLQGYQTRNGLLLRDAKLKTATLHDQIGAWRHTLTTLAEDFHRGDLRVRPKAYPHTCRYCRQRLLCRLNPSLLQASEEETDADAEAVDA